MTNEEKAYLRYQRAEKKMQTLKGFHSHLWVFIIVTIMIFLVRFLILPSAGILPKEEGFVNWLDINTFIVPAIWGGVVAIHGLTVYRYKFKWIKEWEQQKIQEFMEEDDPYQSTNSNN